MDHLTIYVGTLIGPHGERVGEYYAYEETSNELSRLLNQINLLERQKTDLNSGKSSQLK